MATPSPAEINICTVTCPKRYGSTEGQLDALEQRLSDKGHEVKRSLQCIGVCTSSEVQIEHVKTHGNTPVANARITRGVLDEVPYVFALPEGADDSDSKAFDLTRGARRN